ncbi:hypothetical protein [Rhodoferax sediminis]|jgi:hypothetical protein|uniref:DUF541 domain-containing protein n=1 Tax=Rhodoferax sediminis TaxID=2509614 RepID=A0A515DBZ9_9BURK|nr:hypothetical protein [Rhodoferax sediminis]QDL37937.1 hypothetical protein EUB48_12120 [Rhodoferax sediminis]
MKNPITPTVLAALLAMSFIMPAWCADAATDAAQVTQQASEMPALERAAAQAAGWKSVTVHSAAHQLTITVTDSPQASPAEREAQASKMVAAIEARIEKKPAFAQISVIHVDYVKRAGQTTSPVQGFDFYQTPAGAFVPHKS